MSISKSLILSLALFTALPAMAMMSRDDEGHLKNELQAALSRNDFAEVNRISGLLMAARISPVVIPDSSPVNPVPVKETEAKAVEPSDECIVCYEDALQIGKKQGSHALMKTNCCQKLICSDCFHGMETHNLKSCPSCIRTKEFGASQATIEGLDQIDPSILSTTLPVENKPSQEIILSINQQTTLNKFEERIKRCSPEQRDALAKTIGNLIEAGISDDELSCIILEELTHIENALQVPAEPKAQDATPSVATLLPVEPAAPVIKKLARLDKKDREILLKSLEHCNDHQFFSKRSDEDLKQIITMAHSVLKDEEALEDIQGAIKFRPSKIEKSSKGLKQMFNGLIDKAQTQLKKHRKKSASEIKKAPVAAQKQLQIPASLAKPDAQPKKIISLGHDMRFLYNAIEAEIKKDDIYITTRPISSYEGIISAINCIAEDKDKLKALQEEFKLSKEQLKTILVTVLHKAATELKKAQAAPAPQAQLPAPIAVAKSDAPETVPSSSSVSVSSTVPLLPVEPVAPALQKQSSDSMSKPSITQPKNVPSNGMHFLRNALEAAIKGDDSYINTRPISSYEAIIATINVALSSNERMANLQKEFGLSKNKLKEMLVSILQKATTELKKAQAALQAPLPTPVDAVVKPDAQEVAPSSPSVLVSSTVPLLPVEPAAHASQKQSSASIAKPPIAQPRKIPSNGMHFLRNALEAAKRGDDSYINARPISSCEATCEAIIDAINTVLGGNEKMADLQKEFGLSGNQLKEILASIRQKITKRLKKAQEKKS